MITNKTRTAHAKSEKPKQSRQAKLLNSAIVMSAATSEAFSNSTFPDMDLAELIDDLKANVEKVQSGDMASMEEMLVGQAHSLQTIFVSLARKASIQEYLKQYAMYMTLALKAQSQSRATIQALTELKYPKQATFVKQANISNGHQQVNNASNTQMPAHAKEMLNQPNELLEVNHGSETMDSRATNTAIPKDKAMAALET